MLKTEKNNNIIWVKFLTGARKKQSMMISSDLNKSWLNKSLNKKQSHMKRIKNKMQSNFPRKKKPLVLIKFI